MAFIKSSKNQVWTLPPDIRDLIPSDHICYLVESFVDEMDFNEFEIQGHSFEFWDQLKI
jgi:transposase